MKELFLIRHGRQCSRLCNVDVELSPEGRRQARLLGQRLGGYGLEKLYSSELIRARETAEILNEELGGLPFEILPDVEEVHFGGFTGKTDKEIKKVYADYWAERALHRSDLPYPEGGECGADVAARVLPQIRKLCARKEQRIALVTHGGVIRSLCAALLETDQKNKLKFVVNLENTSLTQILYDGDRDLFFLERLNDFAHLEGETELLRNAWR